jgi:hypothetical protein
LKGNGNEWGYSKARIKVGRTKQEDITSYFLSHNQYMECHQSNARIYYSLFTTSSLVILRIKLFCAENRGGSLGVQVSMILNEHYTKAPLHIKEKAVLSWRGAGASTP